MGRVNLRIVQLVMNLAILTGVGLLVCLPMSRAQNSTDKARAGADVPSAPRSFPQPFSPYLPYDVNESKVRVLDRAGKILIAQREFDILSWQAFLALNWPADSSGSPDSAKTLADITSPRVWNFWRPASTIFLPDGGVPAAWTNSNSAADYTFTKTKAAWRQDTTSADENFQAFSGPLVDQNGNW
jgi:hypothetical protein